MNSVPLGEHCRGHSAAVPLFAIRKLRQLGSDYLHLSTETVFSYRMPPYCQ